MQASQIQVALVGDRFIPSRLLRLAIERAVLQAASGAVTLHFNAMDVDWPDTPLQPGDEVSEFVGNPAEVAALARDADVLVVHVAPVTRAVLEQCMRLRLLAVSRGGAINVNVAAAAARGIPVVYAPGRNARSATEFTLALMLAACRSVTRAHMALREGIWETHYCRYDEADADLHGRTVGLVGLGAIAQGLVPYLRPFEARVIAYDPYTPAERFAALGVESVSLQTLLRESDIVSLHARVTPETTHIIGARELALMKPGAYLINAARGPLLDYDALHAALVSGHLRGAALDTFAVEPPPPDWPLLRLPNVTVTPHLAGNTRNAAEQSAAMVADDIANWIADRPLQRVMRPPAQQASAHS